MMGQMNNPIITIHKNKHDGPHIKATGIYLYQNEADTVFDTLMKTAERQVTPLNRRAGALVKDGSCLGRGYFYSGLPF